MPNLIDDKTQYLEAALAHAKSLTETYSTSFSKALLLADPSIRPAIYAIYGMVRIADEIVDTFFSGEEARAELQRFEEETYRAIEMRYSANLALHAFQWAANAYGMSHEYLRSFFNSMRLDTYEHTYSRDLYEEYIYGSAEVVGLLSLSVFCAGDTARQEELTPGACALGAAFQKINFLRDMGADFSERNRIYFPGVSTLPLTLAQKREIEKDIQEDLDLARSYVRQLPREARAAVQLAFTYYGALFVKLKKRTPEGLMERQSVGRMKKLGLLGKTLVGRTLH